MACLKFYVALDHGQTQHGAMDEAFASLFLLTEAFSAKLRMIVFSSVSYEAHILVLKSFER